MPKKLVLDTLQAEAAEIRKLLEESERVGDIVGGVQYKQRLEEINKEINELEGKFTPHASVALYFSGGPVIGSRGILAEFAGKVLDTYQEIISRTYAKLEVGQLGERGKIPLKQNTDLMVTGLTHGSFGFVLEELSDQQELHKTALSEVVAYVSDILFGVANENESEFDRVSQELDARTLISLRRFFVEMDRSEASLRLVNDDAEFTLDRSAVHRGRIRTEATEIDEKTESISGVLIGFLPDHRRFEIRNSYGETIYGTASKEATEQFTSAIQSGSIIIGSECEAEFIIREIKSPKKPPRLTYRLLRFLKLES